MTIDEAIEQFKYDAECNRADLDLSFAEDNNKVAEWLEELKQYRAIGTPEECRAAVEKQKEMIVYCDENDCADCPYSRGNMKENRCMNDFIADEIVKCGGVNA